MNGKQKAVSVKDLFVKIYNETFNFWTYLYIGPKDLMRKAAIKKLDWEASDFDECFSGDFGSVGGVTTNIVDDNNIEAYFIWLPTFINDVEHTVYLGHECGHAAHHALLKRGWRDFHTEDSFHSYLYLKDFLFGNLYSNILDVVHSNKEKPSKKNEKTKEPVKIVNKKSRKRVKLNKNKS